MRGWSIRWKLFAIPLLAVTLVTATTLWLYVSTGRYEAAARTAVGEVLLEPRGSLPAGDRLALDQAEARAVQALDRATQAFMADRSLLVAALLGTVLTILVAAWQASRALVKRIAALRAAMAQLVDDGAAPAADPIAGDEIELVSHSLHTAISHGRARDTQLRRSSEFLEFAQAAGGFGVFDLDLVTGEVTGTPLFFDLLGLPNPAALFTRDEWLATVHPEDFERVLLEISAAVASGGAFRAEYRSLQLDGRTRWLAARGQVLRDAAGLPARAIGTVTDVTERKQLEDTLRYTTDSLNLAQAVAGIATFDLDFAHQRFVATPNYQELLGVPPETRLDDIDASIAAVHPADHEKIRTAPFLTTPDHPSYRCEYRVRLDGGGERWIAETSNVEHDAAGKVVRIIGSLVDVTHLKRTEAALDTLEKRLARTVRGTRDGVWELDIAADRFWFGPRFEEMLGYGEGELALTQEGFYALFDPDSRLRTLEDIKAQMLDSSTFDVEARVRHKAGHYEWVRLRAQAERDAAGTADRARRLHAAHHRPQDRRTGGHRRKAGGRGGEPRQERFSRQLEPRDPHAHERRHRHGADPGRHRAHRAAARIRRHHPRQRPGAPLPAQRRARSVEDRGRAPRARVRALQPARRHLRDRLGGGAAGGPQGHRAHRRHRRQLRSTWTAIPGACGRSC